MLPFVAVNCAATLEELIKSELFDHIKEAFVGATRGQKGKISR
jgi:DNA-binding NtrC family response regulator